MVCRDRKLLTETSKQHGKRRKRKNKKQKERNKKKEAVFSRGNSASALLPPKSIKGKAK